MRLTSCNKLFFLLVVMLLGLTSCEHRLLEDPILNRYFMRVYIDEHLRNVNYGFYDETKKKPTYQSPRQLRLVCVDPETDKMVFERYLRETGCDEKGYYIQGEFQAFEGTYNLMAYTFDVANVNFVNDGTYYSMKARSLPISNSEASHIFPTRDAGYAKDEAICRQPDHVFVSSIQGVKLNPTLKVDTIRTSKNEHPLAESLVKTYYIQVNVKGVEHVRSAVALITGMSGAKTMHNGEMIPDQVSSIYFSMDNGLAKERTSNDSRVAYATFNTFGKLPNVEGYVEISFEFKTKYDTYQTETFRVTDLFDTPMVKDNQWIIIDKLIEITPPEGDESGGGLTPGVNDWDQVEGSVTI